MAQWLDEDVVGWILEADAAQALRKLRAVITPAPGSIAALVAQLKSEDRAAGGLKQDQIAYEAIADVIGGIDACCRRTRELLNAASDVLLGGTHARFTALPEDDPDIQVFRP
jgi:hypothetical protein